MYEFEVQAMDGGGLSDRSKVVILVTDLNDNAPELAITFVINSVPENSPAGTVIAILNARDRDSGDNGEVKCSIPSSLPFRLKKTMESFYSLETEKALDREQLPTYSITVTAVDDGTPPLSTSVVISLQVLDTNDNPPEFLESKYTSYLLENNPKGASAFSLKASDPDWEENARITYSIIESQMKDLPLSSYLSINSETGTVYALSSLDYEEIQEIQFQVKAQDGGSPSLSSNVSVTLFILDQNDNVPEILHPSPPADGSTGIELAPHSSEPGYLVTKVVAVDADSGQNAWLSYQLIRATEPGLFTVGLHTGEIRTARLFLEKDALKQILVVLVKDNGQPPLSASVTLTVVLADNIPEILSDLSNISAPVDPHPILEDILPGAVIALIKVHDRDSGLNGEVTCYLREIVPFQVISSSDNYFKLLIDGPLDREKTPVYNLTLTATDQGTPPLSTDKTILVPISDINDNPPAFEKPSYVTYIPENNPSGTSIFQVKAFDPDLGNNAQITYSMINSNIKNLPLSSYVSINSETGTLYAQRSFDYEQLRDFQLQVQAQDGGSPSLNNSAMVKVCVLDQNDNTPQILYPSQTTQGSSFFEVVPRSADSGYLVTKVVAVDADSGHNAWLSFHLLQATEPSLFIIGSQTGEIQTARALLERDITKQRLVIMVRDNGQPPLSATTSFNLVFAQNFQEALPEMNAQPNNSEDQSKLQFYLVLTLTLVSFLFLVAVTLALIMKLQKSRNTTFFQCFIPDSHSKTGEIILVGSLDFETSSTYEFEVQAMDGGGLSDRSKVVILVTDLNDNPPELAITFVINSVPENSPAGTVIAILNARDRDSGDNGEIKCSIPSSLPFRLKKTMESFYSLETEKALDREQLPIYSITVTAVDDGTPPLSTSVVISLQVLDTNDNPPEFLESKYTSYLLENNPKGASAFSLKASDPDWEENARITYSIIESQTKDLPLSSYLSINSETGTVYALSSLDYEEIQEIQFQVKAQDGGSPSLSSNVSVTLFILDQNDNVPEILHPSPPADGSTGIELAPHSSEPGYLVTKVVAVDADSGQNAWLSYQLIRATEPGLFTVGLHTGEIRTARLFLEKDALKQILVVLVKDNGQPPLSASVTLTVVLADNIPEILSDLSNISAPVDPQSDLTFYLVIATASEHVRYSIPEEMGKGSVVGNLAKDLKLSPAEVGNRNLHILSLGKKQYFSINAENGNLYVKDRIDREEICGETAVCPISFEVKTISLEISDINDNAPAFEKSSYSVYVAENNPASSSIFSIKAVDPDLGRNARITFSILTSKIEALPLPSYLSINSESGTLYSQRSFDYEQLREFEVQVKAEDGGSPPLSSNATVKVFILDQNDQSPQILYPSPGAEGSASFEMVPRSAEMGYLVTKVVAVDADSGHNAWLSYHLLQATEPGLFTIGAHTGEIRTLRTFLERDALKQKLVVLVKDNGQPPLSATVNLNLIFAENFQEALPEINNQTTDSEQQPELQFYLVLALTLISFLFLLTVTLVIMMKLRQVSLLANGDAEENGEELLNRCFPKEDSGISLKAGKNSRSQMQSGLAKRDGPQKLRRKESVSYYSAFR
ncbi:protocadherin gamma-A6 [Crotalus adamanteus]|uniref:Protocadherin gamma-A6 n=1 Tax=Crotalus adamanteus TaxID=8729 RepID=A0AAW1BP44_CROAD